MLIYLSNQKLNTSQLSSQKWIPIYLISGVNLRTLKDWIVASSHYGTALLVGLQHKGSNILYKSIMRKQGATIRTEVKATVRVIQKSFGKKLQFYRANLPENRHKGGRVLYD